jgi:hypothetical protein
VCLVETARIDGGHAFGSLVGRQPARLGWSTFLALAD